MLAFVFWACSENQENESTVETPVARNSDEVAITEMIHEYFDRVMEGDKTVLYENEFTYYTDEISLDDYMELNKVLDYKYDTLAGVTLDSIQMMNDSARLWIKVHYAGMAGDDREMPYVIKAYRSRGGWIRPYLSRWDNEAEYLEMIRQYDSAVAAEEDE